MSEYTESLSQWVLDSTEQSQGELPVFPVVASRLVELLEQPDADISAVEDLISRDQMITAQVLRTANSTLYAGAMPVENVSQALMRLGFREAANIAMAAACRSLFDMKDRGHISQRPFPSTATPLLDHAVDVLAETIRILKRDRLKENLEVLAIGLFIGFGVTWMIVG